MNQLSAVAAPEARPFYRGTFTAWTVHDGSTQGAKHPLPAHSLPEAEDLIAATYSNKETVLVLEHDEIAGWSVLHTYRVRVGKATYRNVGGQAARVTPKTAERICSLRVAGFEPVEPWCWTPGCDVVGRGENIISGDVQ